MHPPPVAYGPPPPCPVILTHMPPPPPEALCQSLSERDIFYLDLPQLSVFGERQQDGKTSYYGYCMLVWH